MVDFSNIRIYGIFTDVWISLLIKKKKKTEPFVKKNILENAHVAIKGKIWYSREMSLIGIKPTKHT